MPQANPRIAMLRKLMDDYGASETDYDEGEVEDPRPYLNGEESPGRFCCVTQHDVKPFFLPVFDTVEPAQARAVEFIADDIWPESPLCVVDLDTGDRYYPAWTTLQWSVKPHDPRKIKHGTV